MTEQIDSTVVIEDIANILKSELPLFWHEVFKYKILDDEFLAVKIACVNYLINGVEGQRPQAVSLSLDLKRIELQPQVFGGNGGQKIYRNIDPNNPQEKYLAMKGVKVPFRKPKQDLKSVYEAIRKFCNDYKQTLAKNLEQLRYKDVVNYDKLLNL